MIFNAAPVWVQNRNRQSESSCPRSAGSLDAFGVHGVGGFVGAILTGVFISGAFGGVGLDKDVTMGHQVWIQFLGTLATIIWSGVASFVILKVIDTTIGLRVSKQVEIEGLDINLHGEIVH